MLELGYVADSVNELFSNSELIALRHSFLAINRKNNGPGKRGSSNVLKVKTPEITINKYVEDGSENNYDIKYIPNRLGFIFYGKLYTIPQIVFTIEKDNSVGTPRILLGNFNVKENDNFMKVIFSLYKSNAEINFIKVTSKLLFTQDFISIGMHEKKLFIFTTKNDAYIKFFLSAMQQNKLPEKNIVFYPSDGKYKYSIEEKKLLDDSYIFIYVKTAFNALAFLKGQEFVLKDEFNYIRESILSNNELEAFIALRDLPDWLKVWAKKSLPLKAHYVIISAENNLLTAYVGFYGECPTTVDLTVQYIGENFKKFIICDYLNNHEYDSVI